MAISPKDVESNIASLVATVIREIDGKLLRNPSAYENRECTSYTIRLSTIGSDKPLVQLAVASAYMEAGWSNCYFHSESPDPGRFDVPDDDYIVLVK